MLSPDVKLITGVLYPEGAESWFVWALEKLEALWGVSELTSGPVPFGLTDYYKDIAPRLTRRFICFKGLFTAERLVQWKLDAIRAEAESRTPRIVNIDPGYLDGARLVLASTKDHAHRIYLRDGIFAEVTMRFRFGQWVPFDYTFPDFASGVHNSFLSAVRDSWLEEKRLEGKKGATT